MRTHTDPAAFSARVRAESAAAHRDAEQSPFVGDLLGGRLPLGAYTDLLAQSWHLYDALEAAGRALVGHPVAGPFVCEELLRLPSLEADLAFLVGPAWRELTRPLPSTLRYRERLAAAVSSAPLFLAHHYIRYLGDLSGGQVIRRAVERVYGLDTDGVRFYVFEGIGRPKLFKDAYRAALDTAALTAAERDLLVAEVVGAFALNRAVFDDLSRAHPAPAR